MPRTPGGERPAPGSEQPGDQDVTEAAVGSPALQSRPPRPAPDSASTSDAGHDARPRNWLLRKKLLTPVVLAVIGVAFALVAWAIYPSRTQLPVPTYTTLHLISNTNINTVTYQVRPFSPSIALVKISVLLPSGSSGPHAGSPQASLYAFPPAGSSLICLPSSCFPQQGGNDYYYHRLTFARAMGPGDLPNVRKVGINAFVAFAVRAHDFGVTADGATASAAIPNSTTPVLGHRASLPSTKDVSECTTGPHSRLRVTVEREPIRSAATCRFLLAFSSALAAGHWWGCPGSTSCQGMTRILADPSRPGLRGTMVFILPELSCVSRPQRDALSSVSGQLVALNRTPLTDRHRRANGARIGAAGCDPSCLRPRSWRLRTAR